MLIHEGYPEGGDAIGEEVGVDAFVRALSDKRIALSVIDKHPTQLSEAVKLAQTIYGNQRVLGYNPGKLVRQEMFEDEANSDGALVSLCCV